MLWAQLSLPARPHKPFPPVSLLCPLLDWNSNHKPTELWTGKKIPPFHSRGNTQIFCVFRTTILFLCLIKLHSEHSIIKTRPEFMNNWSIYYIGQRKDKLYAWKVSLSCASHKPVCWQGGFFFSPLPKVMNSWILFFGPLYHLTRTDYCHLIVDEDQEARKVQTWST